MLLRIESLHIDIRSPRGIAPVVRDLSLEVPPAQTAALVGESGCGKSLTAVAVLRLLPPAAAVRAGRIEFDGQDLLAMPEPQLRRIRGNRIAMIFQEPMTALNPLLPVGAQVAEPLIVHRGMRPSAARRWAVELLKQVNIPAAERRAAECPHQFSGGMLQRVLIAMALACEPALLIADEPTTALDVTIQSQIVELLARLQRETGLSILFITHDLPLIANMAHTIHVMYAGRIVETAPAAALFTAPSHPYARALLESLPDPAGSAARLPVIPGEVPSPWRRPGGCAYHPRCALGRDDPQCHEQDPPLQWRTDARACACWHAK